MQRLSEPPITDKNFSFYGAVHEFEARLIGQALDAAGGNITQAGRLLGLTHQTLTSKLNSRHRALQSKRRAPVKRLKSIIKEPSKK